MNRRLAMVLVALLVLLAGLYAMQQGTESGTQRGPSTLSDVATVDPEKVTRLEIERPGEPALVFARDGEAWHLRQPVDARADDAMVTMALTTFGTLKDGGLISSNPDKAERFEVDPAHGIAVRMFYAGDMQPRLNLVVGKLAPGYTYTFVRVDETHVHRAEGALRFQLQRGPDTWRDKRVMHFDPAQVERVQWTPADSGTIVVARTDGGWHRVADGSTAPATDTTPTISPATSTSVNGAGIDTLVTALANLQAQEFVDPPEALPTPMLTVGLWLTGRESPMDLVVESRDAGRLQVVVDAEPQRYRIAETALAAYLDDLEAALAPPPMAPVSDADPVPSSADTAPEAVADTAG